MTASHHRDDAAGIRKKNGAKKKELPISPHQQTRSCIVVVSRHRAPCGPSSARLCEPKPPIFRVRCSSRSLVNVEPKRTQRWLHRPTNMFRLSNVRFCDTLRCVALRCVAQAALPSRLHWCSFLTGLPPRGSPANAPPLLSAWRRWLERRS